MLEDNVTLRDIWENGQLYDAKEYLRRVFMNYRELEKDLGDCTIRIGLIGSGHAPNYRIEPIAKSNFPISYEGIFSGQTSSQEERSALLSLKSSIGAFNGRSHKRLSSNVGSDNWSSAKMSFSEFQLLREDVAKNESKSLRTAFK